MNVLFWILQISIALHTLAGGVWKFFQTVEQTMPSLSLIPNTLWLALGVIEIICAIALILALFKKSLKFLSAPALIFIAIEMIAFCIIHIKSGESNSSPIAYWAIVAAVCAFIAYGRLKFLK